MIVRKKLIEVDLPLDEINAESKREKSIRHGHPSTLHLWWARRPLAACRAVIFASMVDDPSSCPDEFPTEQEQLSERTRLHNIIRQVVKWESTDEKIPASREVQNEARYEIARSVARSRGETPPDKDRPTDVLRYLNENAPPIYDPFAGGGSIPLEAQRLWTERHCVRSQPRRGAHQQGAHRVASQVCRQTAREPGCRWYQGWFNLAWDRGTCRRHPILWQMDARRGRESHRTPVPKGPASR